MIINWLRTTKTSSGLMLIFRLYLGYLWLSHGIEKFAEGFSAASYMQGLVENPAMNSSGEIAYPWYVWIIENVMQPSLGFLNFMVPLGESMIGLGLIFGCFTQLATFFALLMNFTFFFGGTVSDNPKFILLEIFIIVAGANAGRIGLDYWVIPWIRRNLFRLPESKCALAPALAVASTDPEAGKASTAKVSTGASRTEKSKGSANDGTSGGGAGGAGGSLGSSS